MWPTLLLQQPPRKGMSALPPFRPRSACRAPPFPIRSLHPSPIRPPRALPRLPSAGDRATLLPGPSRTSFPPPHPQHPFTPYQVTYNSLISLCNRTRSPDVRRAEMILAEMQAVGVPPSNVTVSALMQARGGGEGDGGWGMACAGAREGMLQSRLRKRCRCLPQLAWASPGSSLPPPPPTGIRPSRLPASGPGQAG